jgi:hypothetical protein
VENGSRKECSSHERIVGAGTHGVIRVGWNKEGFPKKRPPRMYEK